MTDLHVSQRGIDSSGRAILATDYMWSWWLAVCADLEWTPVIVQGAFMSRVPGGGAADSAGYHDLGGCFDLRIRDLTPGQVDGLVRVLREHGAAAWRRDLVHGGMDPHLHFVLGTDHHLAAGAAGQWQDYIKGRDGLAGNGPDYEWRPSPLVLTPPEADVTEDEMDRIAELAAAKVLASKVGKDETTLKQAVNKILTYVQRQS